MCLTLDIEIWIGRTLAKHLLIISLNLSNTIPSGPIALGDFIEAILVGADLKRVLGAGSQDHGASICAAASTVHVWVEDVLSQKRCVEVRWWHVLIFIPS